MAEAPVEKTLEETSEVLKAGYLYKQGECSYVTKFLVSLPSSPPTCTLELLPGAPVADSQLHLKPQL